MKKTFILTSIIILAVILGYLLLYPRSAMVKEFYKQEENTVDVLILGSSNAYSNINPAVLWDEYGIASYLLCGSGQPIWNSYYYLKEAYKTQSPQVVVLEVFSLAACPEEFDELSNVPSNVLSLKWSFNKIEALCASAKNENLVNLIFGLPIFHNRWTEIFEKEIKPWEYDIRYGAVEKGFYPVFFYETFEKPEVNIDVWGGISEKNKEYLNKIIELTEENGSQLLLIKTPYVMEAFDATYNSVSQIAEERGIKFINMNVVSEDMEFDYANDMADTVHLNNLGVEKVSKYLGEVLCKEYQVTNRKGDEKYNSWESYTDIWNDTLFMCETGSTASLIAEYTDDLYMEQITETLYILNLPILLEQNKTYKILVNCLNENIHKGIVDIFGEGYDYPAQKRKIFVGSEHSFVFIQTDELMPEQTYIRLYSDRPIDTIGSIEVYEMVKE